MVSADFCIITIFCVIAKISGSDLIAIQYEGIITGHEYCFVTRADNPKEEIMPNSTEFVFQNIATKGATPCNNVVLKDNPPENIVIIHSSYGEKCEDHFCGGTCFIPVMFVNDKRCYDVFSAQVVVGWKSIEVYNMKRESVVCNLGLIKSLFAHKYKKSENIAKHLGHYDNLSRFHDVFNMMNSTINENIDTVRVQMNQLSIKMQSEIKSVAKSATDTFNIKMIIELTILILSIISVGILFYLIHQKHLLSTHIINNSYELGSIQ